MWSFNKFGDRWYSVERGYNARLAHVLLTICYGYLLS
jgi:hypothetical protein